MSPVRPPELLSSQVGGIASIFQRNELTSLETVLPETAELHKHPTTMKLFHKLRLPRLLVGSSRDKEARHILSIQCYVEIRFRAILV